ncbi:hypothetical protein M3Y97_00636500 [Aphelenchoides bicaudatus]|nr:hypothetical protein M3Y97_00636500 [Aphelenchoides bicaudatus]
MQNYCVFLLLAAFCFSGVFTLKCDGVGSADFSDKKANRQVLNFLDMLAKEFSGREVTNENILERIDQAHFKNPKVEALLCEFKDLVRSQSFGFKCFACKTVCSSVLNYLEAMIRIESSTSSKICWMQPAIILVGCHLSKAFVMTYREKGDVGAVLIKGVIKNDGGVDPEHICETINVC